MTVGHKTWERTFVTRECILLLLLLSDGLKKSAFVTSVAIHYLTEDMLIYCYKDTTSDRSATILAAALLSLK
jgi:hypothetical protein